ncbi:hypothetical protein F7Q99_36480 [Streptomyces kaniharaensis]|uniref:Flp family type IVb pilin n=1 Tax=Streptomyces kaniharaensis TaxID=212423 RepID=A0A6N7L1C2_9ACTN|nr:hypothetical protein [Streptomyces kaniharaensis]MQS17540.1 hypothetical protein [Streptomyces kaniharaensis]
MSELPDPVTQSFIVYMRHQLYRLRAARSRSDYGGMSIETAIIVGVLVLLAIGLGTFLSTKLTEKEGAIK